MPPLLAGRGRQGRADPPLCLDNGRPPVEAYWERTDGTVLPFGPRLAGPFPKASSTGSHRPPALYWADTEVLAPRIAYTICPDP